jgi:Holliday junction resolvase RusA-like endonuclease
MPTLRIVVYGEPAPKGSPRVVTKRRGRLLRRPLVLDDSEATSRWGRTVAGAALAAMATSCIHDRPWFRMRALRVSIVFRLPRPPTEPERPWPHVKPDLDKLVRATMDPLERIVFDSDSRIVEFAVRKEYARPHHSPGATIEISEMPSAQLALVGDAT